MLSLTRRIGQSLRMGTMIRVTVAEVFGDVVRLNIMAPREVKVLREELYHNNVQNQEAALVQTPNQALISIGDDGEGFFLEVRGEELENLLDEKYNGHAPTLESVGMEPTDPPLSYGLWIWEGDVLGTDTLYAKGTWRKPTPVEWGRFQMGKYLWPDEEKEELVDKVETA